jgi:hypothetical protein
MIPHVGWYLRRRLRSGWGPWQFDAAPNAPEIWQELWGADKVQVQRLHSTAAVVQHLQEAVKQLKYPMPGWPYPNDIQREKGFQEAQIKIAELLNELHTTS